MDRWRDQRTAGRAEQGPRWAFRRRMDRWCDQPTGGQAEQGPKWTFRGRMDRWRDQGRTRRPARLRDDRARPAPPRAPARAPRLPPRLPYSSPTSDAASAEPSGGSPVSCRRRLMRSMMAGCVDIRFDDRCSNFLIGFVKYMCCVPRLATSRTS
jgi:hypothetical protein